MKTGMIFLAGIFIGYDAVNIVLESGKLSRKIRRVIRNCGGIIYSEPEKVSCRFKQPGFFEYSFSFIIQLLSTGLNRLK